MRSAYDIAQLQLPSWYGKEYEDRRKHHVKFSNDGQIISAPAAERAQEEYQKAMHSGSIFFLGSMSHYLLDLACWPHVRDDEDQKKHSAYERAIERTVQWMRKKIGSDEFIAKESRVFNLEDEIAKMGRLEPLTAYEAAEQIARNTHSPPENLNSHEMENEIVMTGRKQTSSDVRVWTKEYKKSAEYAMAFGAHRTACVLKRYFNEITAEKLRERMILINRTDKRGFFRNIYNFMERYLGLCRN